MSIDRNAIKFTYEHYVLYPDDGNRHELIDGDHYMNPAPNLFHQQISSRLHNQLYNQIQAKGLGSVFHAPVDVKLTEHDIVQPDLAVVLNERNQLLTKQTIDGPPNLIVEILSPGTSKNDRKLKKDLYEKVGVDEYWIVDPDACVIEQFVMESGLYKLRQPASNVELTILDGVSVNTDGLWKP